MTSDSNRGVLLTPAEAAGLSRLLDALRDSGQDPGTPAEHLAADLFSTRKMLRAALNRNTEGLEKRQGLQREVRFAVGWEGITIADADGAQLATGMPLRLLFRVHGALGSVQFGVATGWGPNLVRDSGIGPAIDYAAKVGPPVGYDLAAHWDHPIGGEGEPGPCDMRPAGHCYLESGIPGWQLRLAAELLTNGDEPVWASLEAWYMLLAGELTDNDKQQAAER